MEALKPQIAERRTLKGRLTKFMNFVESADVIADIDAFEKRVRANEGIYLKFDAVQSVIEIAVTDTPSEEAQAAEREQFEEKYFYTISAAESRLRIARSSSTPATSSERSPTPIPSDPPHATATRLPIIKLPSFDGNIGNWIRFRDTFTSLVNKTERLTDIDRFNYLIASLSGPAARVIESFGVSTENYKLAWARLEERYSDPKALVAHHIKSLLEVGSTKRSTGASLSELIDIVVNNVRSLESLLQPQEILDALVSACLAKGLDSVSLDEWEKRVMESPAMPSFKQFTAFLEQRTHYLARRDANKPSVSGPSSGRPNTSKPRGSGIKEYVAASHVASKPSKCVLCDGTHTLQYCAKWLAMPFLERHNVVKRSHLCFNCLSPGHSIKACTRGTCRKCSRKHHTLLHREDAVINGIGDEELPATTTSHVSQSCMANSADVVTECTVLSTALVYVIDGKGNRHKCRALLDVGSQANFISQEFCDRVALPRRAVETMVGGLGRIRNPIRSTTQLRISSSRADFKADLSCLVIEKITEDMPNIPLSKVNVPIPSGVVPADPDFHRSGRVDLLIGACLFWDLLCVGQIKVGLGNLMWQKTRLGWVLGGSIPWSNRPLGSRDLRALHVVTNAQLEKSLSRFWEVEEVGSIGAAVDSDPCEQHFRKHVTRDKRGHFVVSIPFNERVHELGESRTQAERRLLNLERRFRRNPDLERQYGDFLREYLELGHMTKLETKDAAREENSFYLPHHAVFKEDSTTTKIRVVFDGSAKTSTGVSLNDTQLTGSTIQDDLFSILIRFRIHNIVLSADIAKMYRQVVVREQDRKYQRILWRFSRDEDIGVYSLNTVTYGTASASYLATRALQQVGKDSALSAPSASKAILRDFYVDDLLTGCETLEQALELHNSLNRVLAQAGFSLRKWASNDPRVFDSDRSETQNLEFKAVNRESKTLGLLWSVSTDELGYSSNYRTFPRITKRYILSEIAQIFDPLGLIGPIIVRAKLFMQGLWQLKLGWDEGLTQDLHAQWSSFRNEMRELSSLRISRRVVLSCPHVEMHGFSDASERAYGAAVYLRSRADNGSWVVHLLCAKSRVAPLKTVTLPRLELCGAVLLAQLLTKVRESLQICPTREYCWTDSQIVLAWIKERPCKWKTFVANRTAEIQTLTTNNSWNHVISADNPADLLSRGTTLSSLLNNQLWWHGPSWLSSDNYEWPHSETALIDVPEQRPAQIVQLATSVIRKPLVIDLVAQHSCYSKLLRIIVYILRFISNARGKRGRNFSQDSQRRPPSVNELKSAERVVIRATQEHFLTKEMLKLKAGRPVDRDSPLLSLHPFLDDHGIIRVGGRLQNAPIAFDQKHPIIVPNSGPLATLLVQREHLRLLHAGFQQTLAALHSAYWLVSGRRVTRKVLRNCVRCFRSNPQGTQPQMGNLPADRVTPARAFATCGVDYAGPFLVVDRGRARTARKSYICLFVCMVTKAVHIELAVDLSTDAFLNCLHRFISRRGRCQAIYSDNGTNFVGARNELKELGILLSSRSHHNRVVGVAAQEGIEWHFIPPSAPHFGGLWERGVRSIKTHMKRVIGEQRLTFEELCTVLAKIEACLNSRPLHPLSPDPLDLNPLTPGHFLIGEALTAIPCADLTQTTQNRLNRFQLLQQMIQHFWKRWQRDYLHGLQQRKKWKSGSLDTPTLGAMVLIKEDNLPPMKWALGRIVELHPGQDDILRVVSIRTTTGVIKRPVTKICLLPIAREPSVTESA